MPDMSALCLSLLDEQGLKPADVACAGIASPGIADGKQGMVMYANNLPFSKTPICAMLAEQTGVKRVCLDNDANAAAWGEAVAGAAQGTSNSVMITLGTGVGGASSLTTAFIPASTQQAVSSATLSLSSTASPVPADEKAVGNPIALPPA